MIELKYFIIYFLCINIFSFLMMGYDKYLAKNYKWRISENTLLLLSLLLGSIGSYIGMYKFRHKTKKTKFTLGIPLSFILNIITIYFLFKYNIITMS